MRASHIAVVLIVALSGVLLGASCVQSQPAPPEVDGAPTIGTQDDDDPFGDPSGDPDIGGGIGSGSPATGGLDEPPDEMATMAECYAAGKGGRVTREAFCRDECPQEKKQMCWSLVSESLVKWLGWCTWNF